MATAANILRLWMYLNHTVWCRHFHIPAVIFRQTRNSCTNKKEDSSAPSPSKIEGARLYLELSSLFVSARWLCPPPPYIAIRARFSAHQTHYANNPKKTGKNARALLFFSLQFATQVYSHQSTRAITELGATVGPLRDSLQGVRRTSVLSRRHFSLP
jgi:hypothetical protein